jgi:protein-S-isoprenylcysteine O-methyltransferase Ste14
MSTPSKTGAGRDHRNEYDTDSSSSTLWRWAECLGGGIVTLGVISFMLPVLADMMHPPGALFTTSLVSVFFLLWFLFWALIGTSRNHLIAATG